MSNHTTPGSRPWGVLVALGLGAAFWAGVIAGIVSTVSGA